MSEVKGLYNKLLEIQREVRGLKKDKKSNNYEYVTGNKVLSFIKPLMDEYGLILKQEVSSIENERIDYRTGIGTQYEKPKSEILTKVMMVFTWIDCDTGEKDVNTFGANGQNEWEKGLGSALTYAERYFILKYFHIPTAEDDIDNPSRKKDAVADMDELRSELINVNSYASLLSFAKKYEQELKKDVMLMKEYAVLKNKYPKTQLKP